MIPTTAATTTSEKIDPLMRIQEEIKEVVRREEEYRQLAAGVSPASLGEYGDNNSNNNNSLGDSINSLSISPLPHAEDLSMAPVAVTTLTLTVPDDSLSNTPSLVLSAKSKESLDEHHSDDSGISASSSPVNGTSANVGNGNSEHSETNDGKNGQPAPNKEHRYIGPNCYNLTPEPPQQKLMTRTVSTPHLAVTKARQFAYSPAHKGVMQRFIASRGKLQMSPNSAPSNVIMLNGKNAAALLGASSLLIATPPNTPLTAPILNMSLQPDFAARSQTGIIIPTVTMTPSVIERDAEGRPLRPGYVPVEIKIQKELKDIKSRENELKKLRKTRQSTSDLLDSIENENINSDDDDDSEVEHCYGPRKLRSAKSINELCDSAQSNSLSPRTTPSPDFDHKMCSHHGGGMRPAISLAQLCDLSPEEAPSSHRLIAQWESLIQQNA